MKGLPKWLMAVALDPAVLVAVRALTAALIGAAAALLADAGPAQGELGAAVRGAAQSALSSNNLPLTQWLVPLLG